MKFIIDGKPHAKQRPRVLKNGHAYTPQETVNYENWVRLCYRQQCGDAYFEGPLIMTITAYLAEPKKKTQQYPTKRPDVDNLIKSIADALNGIAYKDDSAIVKAEIQKLYGKERVEVEIGNI